MNTLQGTYLFLKPSRISSYKVLYQLKTKHLSKHPQLADSSSIMAMIESLSFYIFQHSLGLHSSAFDMDSIYIVPLFKHYTWIKPIATLECRSYHSQSPVKAMNKYLSLFVKNMKDKVVVNYPHLGLKFSSLLKRFTGRYNYIVQSSSGTSPFIFFEYFLLLTNKIWSEF